MRRADRYSVPIVGATETEDDDDITDTTPENDPDQLYWRGDSESYEDDGDGDSLESQDTPLCGGSDLEADLYDHGYGALEDVTELRPTRPSVRPSNPAQGVPQAVSRVVDLVRASFSDVKFKPMHEQFRGRNLAIVVFVDQDGRARILQS